MAFVGNLFWFVFGGIWMGLSWILLGLLMCCTVVGIPFGLASFRIARFAFFPFGKELIDARMMGEKRIMGTGIVNVMWVVLAGFWLAIGHVISGLVCFVFFFLVFPIPFGLAHFKLASASFAPLGKRVVPTAVAQVARTRHANTVVDTALTK